MARPKRVPYRPDAFQSVGRRIAVALSDRGTLIVVILVAVATALVLTVVFLKIHAASEESAWRAFHRAAGDAEALREALEEYGSTSARPYMLYSLGRAELEPPRSDKGEPRPETDEKRKKRLARAEKALRALIADYPDHFLGGYAPAALGLVLEEQGRHLDAVEVLKGSLDRAPSSLNPKITYDIGRNYFLAGKREAARPYLERASGATGLVMARPYGGPVLADWIENAKYLVAQLGPGERAIRLPETGREPGEKGLDESPPKEKKPEERGGEAAPDRPAEGGAEAGSGDKDEAAAAGGEEGSGGKPAGEPDPAGGTPP